MRNLRKLAVRKLAARAAAYAPAPRSTGREWFRISNADGDRAEVFIYGMIGWDWAEEDVTAYSFAQQLSEITASSIDLRINSPGGYVFDGVAIYSSLINHPATVDVRVDGLAASAASFIAMAGDSITMEKPARMMIHEARGIALGDAADMRAYAQLLEDTSDTIAEIYADRAGGEVANWREAMKAETWYSAAQAVDAGLADRVANDRTADTAEGDDAPDSAPEDRRSQLIRARARVALRG